MAEAERVGEIGRGYHRAAYFPNSKSNTPSAPFLAVSMAVSAACVAVFSTCSTTAPRAAAKPSTATFHGCAIRDDYAWLKAANWKEVLKNPDALAALKKLIAKADVLKTSHRARLRAWGWAMKR